MTKKITTRELILLIVRDTEKVLSPTEISEKINRKQRTVLTVLRDMSSKREISLYSDFKDGRRKYYGQKNKVYTDYIRIDKYETVVLPNGIELTK